MSHVMPDNVGKVKLYRDDVPLFSRFQIEHQIESAYSRGGRPALRRRDRHRPHRGADRDRRQLGARHQGRRHRGDRVPHQPGSGRRSRPPAAPARPRRPDRDRLHRHGVAAQPARGREPPARRAEVRPRARADRQDLALRPDGAVAPAPAGLAGGNRAHQLPALQRHRLHPRHRIDRAARPAHHPGRGDEGEHRRRCTPRCRSTFPRSC